MWCIVAVFEFVFCLLINLGANILVVMGQGLGNLFVCCVWLWLVWVFLLSDWLICYFDCFGFVLLYVCLLFCLDLVMLIFVNCCVCFWLWLFCSSRMFDIGYCIELLIMLLVWFVICLCDGWLIVLWLFLQSMFVSFGCLLVCLCVFWFCCFCFLVCCFGFLLVWYVRLWFDLLFALFMLVWIYVCVFTTVVFGVVDLITFVKFAWFAGFILFG